MHHIQRCSSYSNQKIISDEFCNRTTICCRQVTVDGELMCLDRVLFPYGLAENDLMLEVMDDVISNAYT